jgi:hypothetical protein
VDRRSGVAHPGYLPREGTRRQPSDVADFSRLPTMGNLLIWATEVRMRNVGDLAVNEHHVLEKGMDRLAEILGPGFEVVPHRLGGEEHAPGFSDIGADSVYTVRSLHVPSVFAQVVVEAKASLTPAAAKEVLLPQVRLMRQLFGQATVLVVVPWLSPRTRDVLAERQVSYLDLTGNVDLRLPSGVVIKTEGAQHNPAPTSPRRRRGLSGAVAGTITRLLVDFAPPYRGKDLAEIGGISPGYVSRVLQTLDDEALITRDGSVIIEVDWRALLRARAQNYDVLRSNAAHTMVARTGPDAVYRNLLIQGAENTTAVTGSYAARQVAPIAVGGTLMIYILPGAHSGDAVAQELSLMPAVGSQGNVILLEPNNMGPLERLRTFGAAEHVGLSQLAIDCLSGPGRMPAEGEAVLTYMTRNEDDWRRAPGELTKQAAALS